MPGFDVCDPLGFVRNKDACVEAVRSQRPILRRNQLADDRFSFRRLAAGGVTRRSRQAAMTAARGQLPTIADRFECFAPGPNTALFPRHRSVRLRLGAPLLRRSDRRANKVWTAVVRAQNTQATPGDPLERFGVDVFLAPQPAPRSCRPLTSSPLLGLENRRGKQFDQWSAKPASSHGGSSVVALADLFCSSHLRVNRPSAICFQTPQIPRRAVSRVRPGRLCLYSLIDAPG
jgi:hypothetical protein